MILSAAGVCGLFFAAAVWVNQRMDFPDFLVYWLAGELVGQGHSPYDTAMWVRSGLEIGWYFDLTFLYPLPTAFFFVPWGLLVYRFAYTLWMFFTMALVTSAVLLLVSTWKIARPERYLLPIFAGLLVYRPFLVTVRNGQLGGLLLFILAAGFVLFDKSKWAAGGLVLSLLVFKPNLGGPVLALVGLWLLWHKRWPGLAGLAGGGLALLAASLAYEPGWLGEYVGVGSRKLVEAYGNPPTIFGAAHTLCGLNPACSVPLGSVISALLVLLTLVVLLRGGVMMPPLQAGSLIVALVMLVTPYTWAYDQLLLVLPIVWLTSAAARRWSSFLAAAILPLAFSIVSLALLGLSIAIQRDTWSMAVPLLCLALAIGFSWPQKKRSVQIQAAGL